MQIVHRKKLQKRKKPDPEQQAYKYRCIKGHIRIEKLRLGRPLPNCPACEKEGLSIPFKYVGRYTIPIDQLKKSKFK